MVKTILRCFTFVFLLSNSCLGSVEEPLKLEAFVVPSKDLYPGQKFKLIYRISYKGDIELSKEVLPFVNPAPLEKTSPLEVKEFSSGNYNIQEIIQEVRASKAGKFEFGSAILEGNLKTYIEGNPDIQSIPVKAELLATEVDVAPFPQENKPVSFTGALGNYTMAAALISNPNVNVNDYVTVQLVLKGNGEWDTVKLPNLMCQPGFSGFFQLSDLPPQEKREGNSKTFVIQLKVISPHVASLPVIEFSFFNLEKKEYQTLLSEKIPINVKSDVEWNADAFLLNRKLFDNSAEDWQKIFSSPIQEVKLKEGFQLKSPFISTNILTQKFALALFLISLALLFLQHHLKQKWELYKVSYAENQSLKFIQKASETTNLNDCIAYVEKGLILELKKQNFFETEEKFMTDLPQNKILEIKNFLSQLSEMKFGKGKKMSCSEIINEAFRLYNRISEKNV